MGTIMKNFFKLKLFATHHRLTSESDKTGTVGFAAADA